MGGNRRNKRREKIDARKQEETGRDEGTQRKGYREPKTGRKKAI